MQFFLAKTAAYLFKKYGERISDVCIVLPNRRAGLFLKTHLAALHNKPLWAPELFSIEDFLSRVTGITICDNITLTFRFYEVYKEIEGNEAQPFEEFIKWAQVLLHDYNEIDSYLADSDKLFSYINETRAMEVWNIDGKKPSEFQKNYLQFWESLGIYYENFKADLIEKKQAYPGLVFRTASTDINGYLEQYEKKQKWTKIIFAGFNALNEAEEKIIRTLLDTNKAEILWDADSYYLNNNNQEAGKFLRKFIGKEVVERKKGLVSEKALNSKILWIEDSLETEAKEINIIGVSQKTGQAKVAGDILSKLKTADNYKDTALVLADEQLLLPVLNALPEPVSQVNVTMGYPLRNTPFSGLIEAIFQLQENPIRMNVATNDFKFYYKDIIRFLSHPYLNYIKNKSPHHQSGIDNILHEIKNKNRIFLKPAEISVLFNKPAEAFQEIQPFFENWNNDPDSALKHILHLIQALALEIEGNNSDKSVESEYLYYYARIVRQIKTLMKSFNAIIDLKTLKIIFSQLVSVQTLPFYGEPLTGLQLMGMLETRTLDFNTVILLSANEGILPSGKTQNSFIPYEIKKTFKLPTHTEKDAIFAYHFYRLIQRAKNLFILYNTETDEFGSGEKSRFITQLLYELPKANPNVNIREQVLSLPVLNKKPVNFSIKKSEEILAKTDQLCASGLSPSAINTYNNCPLDFYYKYILKLREEMEVEETIEAASMGTFIHHALSNLYKPIIGKKATLSDLDKMLVRANEATRSAFNEKFSAHEINYGKNYLSLNVAINFIKTFLKKEKEYIKWLDAQEIPLVIKSLEEEINAETTLTIGETVKTIKFKGTADRIDQVGDVLRIIDYKTGFVDEKELKMTDLSEISSPEKSKSLQLLLYSLMYLSTTPNKSVSSGIISFKKLSGGLMNFSLSGESIINAELIKAFEAELKKIILSLYDQDLPFKHREGSVYCAFC